MISIDFTSRQKQIIKLVKENEPITSEQIAEKLHLTRAALRADLTVLTMVGELEARPKIGYFYNGKAMQNEVVDFMNSVKVGDVKSKAAVVTEETMLYDAIVTLFLKDTGTLYIVNDADVFLGVVSRKDIIKIAIGSANIHQMPVGVVMSRMPNIVCIQDKDSILDAVEKIIECQVDSLPVIERFIDQSGKEQVRITGKVSKTGIAKFLYDLSKKVALSQ